MLPGMTPDEINATTPTQLKVTENRLRRAAQRQGLGLAKSRTRDPRALDYGRYQLYDLATNSVAAGELGGTLGLGLEDVERALRGKPLARVTHERPSR